MLLRLLPTLQQVSPRIQISALPMQVQFLTCSITKKQVCSSHKFTKTVGTSQVTSRAWGLAGHFTGNVTSKGHVQFTVLTGISTLSFEGDIKIGGDITGTFEALNQQRQFTGEFGPWNVSSNQ